MKNKSKLKKVMTKVTMVQIPEVFISHGVLKTMYGRESFKDTDEDLNERIYTGDVFEAILSEDAQLPKKHFGKLNKETIKQLTELAHLCGGSEYVQITKIG